MFAFFSNRCGWTYRSALRAAFLVSALFAGAGCGGYSGPSDYEKLKMKESEFSDVIAAAGGKATKEGASMFGYQATGWKIDLSGGKVTDELIANIIEVVQQDPVFLLNLSKTAVTDDHLAKMDAAKLLQKTFELQLNDTSITDGGLDKLENIHCLSTLGLKGSRATSAGARRLGDRKIAHVSTPAVFKKQPKVDL